MSQFQCGGPSSQNPYPSKTRWAEGNMQPLKDALRSRVWQHGRAKEPQWLVQSLCGGAFDAAHYTNYLKNKYTELYGL